MTTCFFCNKSKGIMLDRRLRETLPREACYDKEPCDDCKNYMSQGIILISVKDGESGDNPYRTGGWVVIKEQAALKVFDKEVLEKRVCFVEDTAWEKLGLPKIKR